jgi:hypothetical protein
MLFIPHLPFILMQSMLRMSRGLSRLMTSSRMFYLIFITAMIDVPSLFQQMHMTALFRLPDMQITQMHIGQVTSQADLP